MHRSKLIADLEAYGVRWRDELAVVGRFIDFIRDNERCFERDCWAGHVTGSAWLVNPARTHVLLTHHKKLDRWLQPGGHSDGHGVTLEVALREAEEESGLEVEALDEQPFDIDIHAIPAREDDPAHHHYDVRYVLGSATNAYRVSDESHDLAWVAFGDMPLYTREPSMLRMLGKWQQRG